MNDPSEPRKPRGNGANPDRPAQNRGFWPWLKRLFGHRNGGESLRDTIEELIEQENTANSEPGEEIVFLRNVLQLRDLAANDVMVPRADIVGVEIDTSLEELVSLMSGSAHSRMPVFRETLDDAVGMVHIKDIVAWRSGAEAFTIGKILRRILFVAPSTPILELLLQMRVSRTHMALVVDEFGGTDGLVTIEDLVEEIVGEIEDEHDRVSTPALTPNPDGSFEADGRVPVETLENKAGVTLLTAVDDEEIETLGGLVFALVGRVPRPGERIAHPSGVEFEILDADPRRVKRLRVRLAPPSGATREGTRGPHAGR